MMILMRRACHDNNDSTKKEKPNPVLVVFSFGVHLYQLHTPVVLAIAGVPGLHSGVCCFIGFDARYLTSSLVRHMDELVWGAALFLIQAFCTFAFLGSAAALMGFGICIWAPGVRS